MKDFRILLAALCLGLLALTACDSTQKREEAINRGDGPVLAGARQCHLVQGQWQGDDRGCKVTPAACPSVGGTWAKGIGCIAVTAEHDRCDTSGGLAAVDGQCVIEEISAANLDDAWTCHAAQGQWLAETRRCWVTAHLCEQSRGAWQPDIGCEITLVAADQCSGMSGLSMIHDRCIMVDLSREELEQMGAENIERARSKLNQ